MVTAVRKVINNWLRKVCKDIKGDVISIGSAFDNDGEGAKYRDYFSNADSYTTSDTDQKFNCDLVLDVTDMNKIPDAKFDCVFCSSVLEHVFDFKKGLSEITRILKSGGILLLGVPFRYEIHMEPHDFWRFTKFAIQGLLKDDYKLVEIEEMCPCYSINFPSMYWVKAKKTKQY